MKVLVTGANGQLGRCLQDRLRAKTGFDFLALDSKELDITDAAQIEKTLAQFQPGIVVNAAAYTAVDKAESEPEKADKINRQGTENLARACTNSGAVLVHVSTDYVFDGTATQPYKESDTTAPLGVYGKTKLAGEQGVASLCPKHIILRTAWVYSEYGQNFVKTMLRLAASRTELNVVEDQQGCPTYAGDIAEAILTICQAMEAGTGTMSESEWGIYHYVGATQCSWADFARVVFVEARNAGMLEQGIQVHGIPTSEYPTPAERPRYSVLDCKKIRENFGVAPVPLEQSLPVVLSALNALEANKD